MSSPAVILKSKFIMPNVKEYKDYVEYIDRDDAKKEVVVDRDSEDLTDFKMFHHFMEYMGDEEKDGQLFTENNDELTNEQKQELKDQFKLAQKNGSPLWQDVISFDNEWLEKEGYYDSETHTLDEEKVRGVVRSVMNTLQKAEDMEETSVWSASVHYNTDNIHVHIATVEPFPTRKKVKYFDSEEEDWVEEYRGKRKQGTIDKMKSNVANLMLDRTEDYNRIDSYIRDTAKSKRENDVELAYDKKTKALFHKALSLMPDDLKEWRYGYQSVNKARPYIDEMVDIYLETYHKDKMEALDHLLDKQTEVSRQLYGNDSRYSQYKETKTEDLKKRMGNAVLTEMRNYRKDERRRSVGNRKGGRLAPTQHPPFQQWKSSVRDFNFAVMRLRYSLRKTKHEYDRERNISEYDRMLEESQRE